MGFHCLKYQYWLYQKLTQTKVVIKMTHLEIANHLTRLGKELKKSDDNIAQTEQEHLAALCLISGQLEHLVAQIDEIAKPLWKV